MANPGPKVTCEACDGAGVRELTEIEAETLAAVRDQWASTHIVRQSIPTPVNGEALANRLVRLHARGLIERRRGVGNRSEWRLAKRTEPAR